MKKFAAVFVSFLFAASPLVAENLDGLVKTAVEGLASGLASTTDVYIGDINIAGNNSPGALSRALSFRIAACAGETGKFRLVRGSDRFTSTLARISGEFMPQGDAVKVTLRLQNTGDAAVIDSRTFSVPLAELNRHTISLLPENIKTINELTAKEAMFKAAPSSDFTIQAWPNSDSRSYFEGDSLSIHLLASQECYVKVYYIDTLGKIQLLFPNQNSSVHLVPENENFAVPLSPLTLTLDKPGLGMVWVQASAEPFTNVAAEFNVIKNAGSETIAAARLSRQKKPAAYTETFFSIVTLPAHYFDVLYVYPRPSNMNETIRNLRADVLRRGGKFSGEEREGSFTVGITNGTYRTSSRNTITLNLRYTAYQFDTDPRGRAFSFTIPKPQNMTEAVQSLRTAIESRGGTFSGDEQQGSFQASGITGQYRAASQVTVIISEKPDLISNALFEKEVRSHFSGK